MLSEKPWRAEAVLMLVCGVVLSLLSVSLAAELLHRAGVDGFKNSDDAGNVLAATLSFHGAVIVLGIIFLKLHAVSWRDVFGLRDSNWKRHLLLAAGVLAMVLPLMLGLKAVSETVLEKLGRPVHEQDAVAMFSGVKSAWLRVYLGFFTVTIAPLAEEFFFRGLLFSAAKRLGRPMFAWFGVSLLFALMHRNAPTFVPLFVFALVLTWLYEKTGSLLAPVATHAMFNATNLAALLWQIQHPHA
jgi:membrane protease YdiL (CAAX protease family)